MHSKAYLPQNPYPIPHLNKHHQPEVIHLQDPSQNLAYQTNNLQKR